MYLFCFWEILVSSALVSSRLYFLCALLFSILSRVLNYRCLV